MVLKNRRWILLVLLLSILALWITETHGAVAGDDQQQQKTQTKTKTKSKSTKAKAAKGNKEKIVTENEKGTEKEKGKEREKPKSVPGKPKNWNKIDLNEVEKEWEDGDDKAILEQEFEVNRRIQAKKQPKLNMEDGASIQRAYKSDPFAFSSGGGMMVFIDLKATQLNGQPWTSADVDQLSKKYSSLMRSGSLPTTIYNIGDNRLLINTDKTWQTKDILQFLARQPEIEQFTANSKTYKAKEFLKEFDPEYDPDDDDL